MRFREVFILLLLLSFLSAFVLPVGLTNPARNLQALFYPVARPARSLAATLSERLTPPPKDDRAADDVRAENIQLRMMVSQLTAELLELQRINADRQLVGDLRQYCTPVRVIGTDSGRRESIALKSGSLQGIAPGQPVISSRGLVGKVWSAGALGSQVLLITDREFRAVGEFRRFERDTETGEARFPPAGSTPPLVKGAGEGLMTIENVPLKETSAGGEGSAEPGVAPVKIGDLVLLNDPEWEYAGGQWLGQVETIEAHQSAPLFARITVRPMLNLAGLREVQVMNKTPADAARTAGAEGDSIAN